MLKYAKNTKGGGVTTMITNFLTNIFSAGGTSSFLLESMTDLVNGTNATGSIAASVFGTIINFLASIIYTVCQFCL